MYRRRSRTCTMPEDDAGGATNETNDSGGEPPPIRVLPEEAEPPDRVCRLRRSNPAYGPVLLCSRSLS